MFPILVEDSDGRPAAGLHQQQYPVQCLVDWKTSSQASAWNDARKMRLVPMRRDRFLLKPMATRVKINFKRRKIKADPRERERVSGGGSLAKWSSTSSLFSTVARFFIFERAAVAIRPSDVTGRKSISFYLRVALFFLRKTALLQMLSSTGISFSSSAAKHPISLLDELVLGSPLPIIKNYWYFVLSADTSPWRIAAGCCGPSINARVCVYWHGMRERERAPIRPRGLLHWPSERIISAPVAAAAKWCRLDEHLSTVINKEKKNQRWSRHFACWATNTAHLAMRRACAMLVVGILQPGRHAN